MIVNKIKGAFHKSWSALFAFIIPVFLVTVSMVVLEVAPFGENSFIFGDANGYYINYISYYKTILAGEHSIFYSFAKGMGSNIFGAANYDITSPYMLLFLLFPKLEFCTCYTFSIIFMAGLTGLAMERLLNDVYGMKPGNLIFSTAYAMSGFCVVFNYNLLFMTGPLMLPVTLLGLRRLIKGQGYILYPVTIAYAVATHFQMGFGVCVGVLVCFAGVFYVKYYDWEGIRIKMLARFALGSLAGGLIAGFVWYPTLLSLQGGRAGQLNEDDFIFTANNVFLEMGSRLFTGANNTDQIIDGFPAIFVGIFVMALVILFFVTKEINIRQKQGVCGVLVFYLLSFYLKPLKNVLQGFTHANWFHFRYSYVFSCVLVLIAAEAYAHIRSVKHQEIKKTAAITVLATILIFSKEYDFIDGAFAAFDLAILFIMGGLVYIVIKGDISVSDLRLSGALLAITSIQLVANYILCNQSILDNWNTRVEDYKVAVESNDRYISAIKKTDDGFYRIENEKPRVDHSGNDGMFFDYFGVGYSGNNEKDFVADGVADLGLSRRAREITYYNRGTPAAMDSFMGIKYLISNQNLTDEKLYNNTGLGDDKSGIYENPYVLPIAILSDDGISEIYMGDEPDIFMIQNNIWKAMTSGTEDIFIPEDEKVFVAGGSDSNKTVEYTFKADRTGSVYLYDATGVSESYGSDKDVMQYVGYFHTGDTVTGSINLGEDGADTTNGGQVNRNLLIYYVNDDVLWDYSNILQNRDCTVKYESDTRLTGHLDCEKGQRLLLTIPYDEGWSLYIDGKKTKIEKTVDFLMSSPKLSAGEHDYELKYTLPGLNIGIMMLVSGVILMTGMALYPLFPRKKEESNQDYFSSNNDLSDS